MPSTCFNFLIYVNTFLNERVIFICSVLFCSINLVYILIFYYTWLLGIYYFSHLTIRVGTLKAYTLCYHWETVSITRLLFIVTLFFGLYSFTLWIPYTCGVISLSESNFISKTTLWNRKYVRLSVPELTPVNYVTRLTRNNVTLLITFIYIIYFIY